VNGEYPYFNETHNIQPAVILPKSEISDDVQVLEALDHVLIKTKDFLNLAFTLEAQDLVVL
jgi:hypothetical protein